MLESSHERVKLLKAGVFGKTIEKLYLVYNNIKLVNSPLLLDSLEISRRDNGMDFSSGETGSQTG